MAGLQALVVARRLGGVAQYVAMSGMKQSNTTAEISMRHNSYLFAALIALILAILVGSSAHALDWHTANQVTVAWDANNPDIPSEELSYEVFQADINRENQISLGTTNATSLLVTLTTEGQFILGVQSVRTVDEQEVARSPMAWSDDPAVVADVPFGVMYYTVAAPTGLRLE